MQIEATGILVDPAKTERVSEETAPEKSRRAEDSRTTVDGETRPDRLEYSARAIRKRFSGQFRRLAQDGFEKPEKSQRLARKLEHRFRDALKALKEAGVLEGSEVKSLRRAYRNALNAVASAETSTEFSSTSSVQQSRTFSLDIETAEGDSVSIQLQRQTSVEQSLLLQSNAEDGISAERQRTLTRETSLSFQVEGNLNEAERAAIDDLVGRVDQLAAQFFEGDVQATLNYVQEFGVPGEEIASFSANLGYSLEAQVINAYRQVDALAVPEDAPDPTAALDLGEDLRVLSESTRLEQLFRDSRSLVFDFFRVAVESDPQTDVAS